MPMTPDEIKTMCELRNNGYTYQAIADQYGITRQRVHAIISKRSRKITTDIDKIVYDGIYKLFVNDPQMTYRRFAAAMNGLSESGFSNSYVEHACNVIFGRHESRLTIRQIENICRLCGMSF